MKSAGYRIFFASLLISLLLAGGLAGCGSSGGSVQSIQFDSPDGYWFSSDVVSVGEGGSSIAELKRLPDDAFWTTYYQDTRPMHGAEYHRSTVLPDGSVIAVGETTDFENGTGALLIGRHGADGQMMAGWPKLYAAEGARWNEASDVVVDHNGYIIVTGYVITRGEQWRLALWYFDPDGNLLPGWPQYPVNSHSYGISVSLDSDGDVVVCGGYGSTGLESMVLAKYQAADTGLGLYPELTIAAGWPKTYKIPKSAENFGYDLLKDTDGNLVVAGYTAGATDGPRDAVLWKMDSEGNQLAGWPMVWDSGMAVYDEFFSISQDAKGNYCLVGTTDGTTELNGRLMTTAYSKEGNLLAGWPQVDGGNGLRDASPPDAWRGAGDLSGSIEGAGTYQVDLPAGTKATELPETQVSTARYGPDGKMSPGFPRTLGRAGYQTGTRSSSIDTNGNIYVVGWSEGTDGTHSDYSTFLTKYPPAAYATGRPGIVATQAVNYSKLIGFSEKLGSGNQGSVAYQLSPNAVAWYYFDGTKWTVAADAMQANSATDVNKNIGSFATSEAGMPGTVFVQALLASDGTQAVQLDSIEIKYE